jgi:hypothetical protein
MVDKWYEDLTPEEKAKTLLLGNDVYAFFHSDPETCIDTQGCTSPVTLRQGFEIVNDEVIPLWFKVFATVTSGDPTKWSDLIKELGSVPANGAVLFFWTPKREIPASLTHEAMTLTIRAYKDSGYTQLYGEDTIAWEFYFFDHSWPDAVIIDEDDFEGTLDGWGVVGYERFEYKTGYAYKGAYSLNIAGYRTSYGAWKSGILDSSGQWVPYKGQYMQKGFAIGAFSHAFAVIHLTKSGMNANNCVRVHYDDKDYIIRTGIPVGPFQPWRCCAKLWVDATKALRVSVITGADGSYSWDDVRLDDIIIVAFPGCPPTGEQFTNGEFETGDLTGWIVEGTHADGTPTWEVRADAECQPDGLGLRAWLAAKGTDPPGPIGCPRITGALRQELASPIPVECFTDSSVFKVQTKWGTDLCNPVPPEVWQLEVLYTDGTSTVVDLTGDPQGVWVSHELKPVLVAGKKVKGVKFTATVDACGGPGCGVTEVMADNCTCTT